VGVVHRDSCEESAVSEVGVPVVSVVAPAVTDNDELAADGW
jgi:hypothetical protein